MKDDICPFCKEIPPPREGGGSMGIADDDPPYRTLICWKCADKIADFYGRARTVERLKWAVDDLQLMAEEQNDKN